MKSKRSRILRSSDRTGENQDRRRKDKKSTELANSKRSQGYTKFFGISQLLSAIHQGFCIYS